MNVFNRWFPTVLSGFRTQNKLKQTGLRGIEFVRRRPSGIPNSFLIAILTLCP